MAEKNSNLYIIDGHAHIYAAHYAPMRQHLVSPDGEPTKATYIFAAALLGLIQRVKPDMLVVAMDSKTPSFRAEIYPEYKAHRPPMPEELPVQIKRIEQLLEAMNIPVLRIEGYEADDIIGTLAKKASEKKIDTYICSRDKDFLQLLDKHIFTYEIKTGKIIDTKSMKADMGILPEQFIDCLALQGDTADNVPGVPDVGPKTALDWIKKYGSLDNLYEHASEIKGKRGESLRNSKNIALLSKQLVTINCDCAVDIDTRTFKLTEPNKDKLSELFAELGFKRLLSPLNMNEMPADLTEAKDVKDFGESTSAKELKHDYQLVDTKKKFEKLIAELKRQKLFAIDTETTSVSAMKADLVGMSFSFQAHKAFYLPVKAPMGAKCLSLNEIRAELAEVFQDKKIKKVGQNIKYDLLILQNAGLALKGVCFDTMVASYCLEPQRRSHSMDNMAVDFLNYQCLPLHSLIGKGKNQLTFDMVDLEAACEYAAEDADVTLQLYEYLKDGLEKQPQLKDLFERVEMPLVLVLAAMEFDGVSIDSKLLRKLSTEFAERLEKITGKIYKLAGSVFNIDSPKQLSEVLFDEIGLTSIRSVKTSRSTDAGVLEQLAGSHPIIELIIQYRQLAKLKNTYVDKLPSLVNPKTNRVHASFNQTITATGRLSSSNPNLQNIPIRTEFGRKIRSAFVPACKTDCILSADYSQIELRLLAHFSKDEALKKAFEEDRDIHAFVASQIYGVSIEEVTSEMRSSCKAINFGIIYGQGPFGLSRSTGMSVSQAKKFIDDYFARYSSIQKFMDDIFKKAQATGYAETILHRRREIENVTSGNKTKLSQAKRFVINTVIQGSAADLIKIAMINIQKKIESENLPAKMILQIHDELVFELPKTDVKKYASWIVKEMTQAIALDVPLKVDVNFGSTWLK